MNLKIAVGERVLELSLSFPYGENPTGYRVLLPSGKTGIVLGIGKGGEHIQDAEFPDDKPIVSAEHLETLRDLSKLYGLNPWALLFNLLPEEFLWKEETYLLSTGRSTYGLDSKSMQVISYVQKRKGVKEKQIKNKFGWQIVELLISKGFLRREKRWDIPEVKTEILKLGLPFEEAYEKVKRLRVKEEKLSILNYLKERTFASLDELRDMEFKVRDINYLLEKGILVKEEYPESYGANTARSVRKISTRKLQKSGIICGSYSIALKRLMDILQTTFLQGRSALIVCTTLSGLFSLEVELKNTFGDDLLVISSKEKPRDLLRNWFKAQDGNKIVLGSRLSLLVPVRDIDVIAVFDDAGTKLPNGIDIRNFLYLLSKYTGAKFLIVSPAIDIHTYNLIKANRVEIEYLTQKLEVHVVKRKEEEILCSESVKLLEKCTDRKVLFLVNKKGYGYAYCPKCQNLCICPFCGTFLTLYKESEKILCTSCGFKSDLVCPECASDVRSSSFGIEKAMEKVEKLFGIRKNFTFGTFPAFEDTYDLVIVLNADNLLSVPFFNAEESYYRYLWRARAIARDRLLIQTLFPEHPILKHLQEGDWKSYCESELIRRREEKLPPFSRILLVRFTEDKSRELQKMAKNYGLEIRYRKTGRLMEALVRGSFYNMSKIIKEIRILRPIHLEFF